MHKRVILSVINDLTIDQRLHKVCTTLLNAGYEVELVGRKKRNSLPLTNQSYKTTRLNLIFEKGKLFYLEYNLKLFFYLLFKKVDILTANDLDTLLPNFLVAKMRKKDLIFDTHEYFTEMPELVTRPQTQKIWLILEKFLFPRLDKISTVNNSLAAIYKSLYKKELTVVKNVPYRTPIIPKEKIQPIIIYQGNINLSRNIDKMLKAVVQLPEVIFWCVGPGDLLEEMKSLTIKLGIQNRVKFWGQVPFNQLPPITQQAKIGISIEAPLGQNSALCLPNKLMDYIQAGLPVIVTPLPEMKNLVETYKNGIILNDDQPETITKAINLLLKDKELYNTLSINSLRAAEELCWENESSKLLALYN